MIQTGGTTDVRRITDVSSTESNDVSAATTAMAGMPGGESFPVPPAIRPEVTLTAGQWGMISFLVSEVALFGTLIVTYLFYVGRDVVGPTPAEALSLGLVLCTTTFLLASSATVHVAERSLERRHHVGFLGWWAATVLLGAAFLGGTALEWRDLIERHHLTISRNLFGSTYYTLVGLHAVHVTAGLTIMLIVLALALGRQITSVNRAGVGLVAWYWHFVDGVWVVVFTVVYLVGR
jgi:cytochrome c oxidase subunit 3/cytochrome o ubiquinol oxidase subunit 3